MTDRQQYLEEVQALGFRDIEQYEMVHAQRATRDKSEAVLIEQFYVRACTGETTSMSGGTK